MKTRLALILGLPALALSVWLWFHLTGAGDIPLPPKPGPVAPALPPPTTTQTDATEVFQRAFWKRPAESDRILHAERREWLDDAAVSRWDWFLEVEPSPEIIRHLREDNAFRVSRTASAEIPENAPEWFIRETTGSQIYTAPGGGMQLIFLPGDTKLFATGSGGGFHRGVPEVAVPQTEPNPPGRIPTSPPEVER